MDGKIPGVARHEAVLFSDQFEIRGVLEMRPPRRFLDFLNDRFRSILTITEASIRPLFAEPGGRPLSLPSLVINKNSINLAWLLKEKKVAAGDFVTIHKVARPVTVYLGPFVARGQLHAIQEATLAQALDAVTEDFIALTKPSLICLANPSLSLQEGIIAALRKDKITALQERT